MASTRSNNLKKLMSDGKSRLIVITVGVTVGAIVLYGLYSAHHKSNTPAQIAGSASVAPPPMVQNSPGSSDSASYNQLQNRANADAAASAAATGTSTLPVLTNNSAIDKKDPLDMLNNRNAPPAPASAPVASAPVAASPVVAPPAPVEPPKPAPVRYQRNESDRQAAMRMVDEQVKGYMGLWGPGKAVQEFNVTGRETGTGAAGAAAAGAAGNAAQAATAAANGAASSATGTAGPAFVRAGTIVPAVMITAVNTDEPGPVLAEVVSGPLKGGRLIGQMRSSNQKVVLEFRTLSLPGAAHTYQIDAFAVDPTTARTAVATDVNNHYFLRYGLTLAAAFISGYGQAVATQGATTTVNALGGTTTTYGQLDNGQITKAALGQVGTTLGQNLQQDTNRQPTVTVDSGTPIGLLFMSDF